jgi:hypothetical protein
MFHRLRLLILPIALATGACDGDDGPSVEEAADQIIGALCDKFHECKDDFPGEESAFEGAFGATEAECVMSFEEDLEVDQYQASIDAGRIIFNSGDVGACRSSIAAISCDDLWGGEIETAFDCGDDLFEGTVDDGDACTIDEDCAGESSSCEDLVCTAS